MGVTRQAVVGRLLHVTSWRLREFLDVHGLSAYAVVQATNGRLAANTVYALASGKTRQVELNTLDAVITALRALTEIDVTPSDLLFYQDGAQPGGRSRRTGRGLGAR